MATIFNSPTPLKQPHLVQSTVVIVWLKQSSKNLKVQKRLKMGLNEAINDFDNEAAFTSFFDGALCFREKGLQTVSF